MAFFAFVLLIKGLSLGIEPSGLISSIYTLKLPMKSPSLEKISGGPNQITRDWSLPKLDHGQLTTLLSSTRPDQSIIVTLLLLKSDTSPRVFLLRIMDSLKTYNFTSILYHFILRCFVLFYLPQIKDNGSIILIYS